MRSKRVTEKAKEDSKVDGNNWKKGASNRVCEELKDLNIEHEILKDGKAVNQYKAITFKLDELAAATHNFRSDCLLGEGGFGKVYRGHLKRMNQVGN